MKYATLLLVAILILNVPTFSDQATGIMSLQFQREVTDKDSAETLKGTVYYQPLHKAFIEILEPISQLMVIDGKVMTIYYPVEKKAFRFHGQGPIPMPFIQNILSVMQDDYGLTEMGYSLTKHKTKADTLYTYWDPPKKLKKKLGQFVLGTSKNRLVYAEAKGPDGKVMAKSFYTKHVELKGKFIPLEVQSEIYSGATVTKEHVVYSNVKCDITLPDRVVNFKVPDSVSVREIKW